MVQIHNTFTVYGKSGRKAVGTNAVLVQPAVLLAGKTAFATYIIVRMASGATQAYETQTVSINANAGKGKLYAEYAVSLGYRALEGETITGFSLSDDSVRAVNTAEIPPFEKASEEIMITAAVYLETDFSNAALFLTDDNPMICSLLGAQPLPDDIAVLWGTGETAPTSAVTETAELWQNRVAVAINAISNGIEFTCELPAGALDAVLVMAKKPVLRVSVRPSAASPLVLAAANVAAENTLNVTYPVLSVLSVNSGATQYTGVQIHNVPKKLTRANGVFMNFDRSLRIISDPSYRNAALVSDREMFYIGYLHGVPSVLGMLDLNGKIPHLCETGEVVLTDDTHAEVYRYTEEDGFMLVSEIAFSTRGTGGAESVSKRNGTYSIVRLTEFGQVEFGQFESGSGYTVTESFAAGVKPLLFRFRYSVCAVTDTQARVWQNTGRNTAAETIINRLRNTNGAIVVAGLDGLLELKHATNAAFHYVYGLSADISFLQPGTSVVRLCGDFFWVRSAAGAVQIYFYYRHLKQTVLVSVPDPNTVEEICRVGEAVLVRRTDGALEACGIESDRSFLYHPLFTAGASTQATIYGCANIPSARRKLVITIQ